MEKVVVGMSGGVDSSVCAYLLKKQGYDVIGVTMQIWQDEDTCSLEENGGCCGLSAVEDARAVANKLEIPYYVMNFKNDFKENVIDYFINEYEGGRTPNPCIACNRYVKWESLLNKSLQLGANYIATGHYAKIIKNNGRYTLQMSKTKAKDQTYALYNLSQEQLKRTLMPVGEFTKDEIRDLALKIGLDVHNKPDSQEICFVPDDDYGRFIRENSNKKIHEGNFLDIEGNIIGEHKGIPYYTIGQRKGLGAFGKPMFVKKININTNEIILSDNKDLFDKILYATDVNFMAMETFKETRAYGKIRYNQEKSPCTVTSLDENEIENLGFKSRKNLIKIEFDQAQRAVTPGQAVVIYNDENMVLGGGTIV
ncbi:MAG: tRNA 2-thiouridine(34) synthase MnmA [Lachnospirales bacterium]